jgi:hypothetical protein
VLGEELEHLEFLVREVEPGGLQPCGVCGLF